MSCCVSKKIACYSYAQNQLAAAQLCLSQRSLWPPLYPTPSTFKDQAQADYTIRGVCGANNLIILSRASSNAYEPYMILKDLGKESLTPSFSSTIPLS